MVWCDVADNQVHSSMPVHNRAFPRGKDAFNANFGLLIGALDTDLEYIRKYTRLLTLAIDWDKNQRRRQSCVGRNYKQPKDGSPKVDPKTCFYRKPRKIGP